MDNPKKLLSIVVPVFNEQEAIPLFIKEIESLIHSADLNHPNLEYEVIFVNDGSQDQSLQVILGLQSFITIKVVNLSRNFGKESALTAGLVEAKGDAVIIMDVDLQDPPSLLPDMVQKWLNGSKVVLARRVDRSDDSYLKRQTAQWFYSFHNYIANVKIPPNVGDFRLMDRVVVNAVNSLPENRRFMKGIFAWIGFKADYVDYKRTQRSAGETKFTPWKLWRFAVEGITSFSDLPLVIWTYIGFFISFASFLYASFIVIRTLIFGVDVPGYASLLTGILFLGGIQILGIGILGEYVGRIYSEVKRRPPYVVSEVLTVLKKLNG